MSTRKILLGVLACLVVVAAMVAMTGVVTHAQGQGAGDSSVLAKLDEVLNGQRAIMEELASLKEELRVIKIRVTQQQ